MESVSSPNKSDPIWAAQPTLLGFKAKRVPDPGVDVAGEDSEDAKSPELVNIGNGESSPQSHLTSSSSSQSVASSSSSSTSPIPAQPSPSNNEILKDSVRNNHEEEEELMEVEEETPKKKKQQKNKPTKNKSGTKNKSPAAPKSPKSAPKKKSESVKVQKVAPSKVIKAKKPAKRLNKKICNNFKLFFQKKNVDFSQVLPLEIMCNIFRQIMKSGTNSLQNLIKMAQTCETWRQAILSTPSIWENLDLQGFESQFPFEMLKTVQKNQNLFFMVKRLTLDGWSEKGATQILEILASSEDFELDSLSFANAQSATVNIFSTITQCCPNITELNLSNMGHHHIIIKGKLVDCFTDIGPKLRSLDISGNYIQPQTLKAALDLCPNLQVLNISNGQNSLNFMEVSVEKLQISCPKLRILRAANVLFHSDPRAATPGWPELEELSIPFSKHNDTVVELLTKEATKLNYLDIRDCNNFTSRSLLKIPSWSLKHLFLSKCRGIEIQNSSTELVFQKWNQSLVDVDLSWIGDQDSVDAAIFALADIEPEKSKVKMVNLRGSAISLKPLLALMKNCPKIEALDLQSCRGMPRGIKREYAGHVLNDVRRDLLAGKYSDDV